MQAKILVVDDEISIVRAVTTRLTWAGYKVVTAYDGMMATDLAFHELPDLVLMDIGMPCGNGHVVAQRLLTNDKTMFIPVVYMTARTTEGDREQAVANHAAGYLTKPFKGDELLDTVSHALAVRKMRMDSTNTGY